MIMMMAESSLDFCSRRQAIIMPMSFNTLPYYFSSYSYAAALVHDLHHYPYSTYLIITAFLFIHQPPNHHDRHLLLLAQEGEEEEDDDDKYIYSHLQQLLQVFLLAPHQRKEQAKSTRRGGFSPQTLATLFPNIFASC